MMHLYNRAIGLKSIQSRKEMDDLVEKICKEAIASQRIEYLKPPKAEDYPDDGMLEAQINADLFEMGGLSVRGLYNPISGEFSVSYVFPYARGSVLTMQYNEELIVERQIAGNAFLVHCCMPFAELSPIFYLMNQVEYLQNHVENVKDDGFFSMSALATEGKIIFPVMQSEKQKQECNALTQKRDSLVDKALSGDKEAIDNLMLDDYDTISDVCHRIEHEDLYSIVDSSFMPSGLECDLYSVVGNILYVSSFTNAVTGEEVLCLELECNNMDISVYINSKDLLGIPKEGYRFVGKIWLLGYIDYKRKDESYNI